MSVIISTIWMVLSRRVQNANWVAFQPSVCVFRATEAQLLSNLIKWNKKIKHHQSVCYVSQLKNKMLSLLISLVDGPGTFDNSRPALISLRYISADRLKLRFNKTKLLSGNKLSSKNSP